MSQKIIKAANHLDYYKHRDDTHPKNLLYELPIEDFYSAVNSEMRSFIEFNIEKLYRSNDFRYDLSGQKQFTNKPYAYLLFNLIVGSCPSTADYTQKRCLYEIEGVKPLDDYCYDTYYTDPYTIYFMPLKMDPRRDAIESIIFTDFMIARHIARDFYINLQLIVQAFVLQIGIRLIFIIILLGQTIAPILIWGFITGFSISLYYQSTYIGKEQQNSIKSILVHTNTFIFFRFQLKRHQLL